jgi:hypothetical protein
VAVRNRSDLPIEIQSVRYVWLPFWYDIVEGGDRHGAYTEESKSANATVLEPDDTWTEERNVYGEGNADGSGGPDPDFVWLTFCDHSNTIWEVRNDSKELRREGWREIRWWQWGFEKLTRRLTFIDRFVVVPWARFAGWSARRHGPNHMPLSMRTLRWLRGGWVHGEPDPWLIPHGVPALWGYGELFTEDELRSLWLRDQEQHASESVVAQARGGDDVSS